MRSPSRQMDRARQCAWCRRRVVAATEQEGRRRCRHGTSEEGRDERYGIAQCAQPCWNRRSLADTHPSLEMGPTHELLWFRTTLCHTVPHAYVR